MTAPQSEFEWHYGPTDSNPDHGLMWHTGCGGEVYGFTEGYICSKCEAGSEPDLPTPPPSPEREEKETQ